MMLSRRQSESMGDGGAPGSVAASRRRTRARASAAGRRAPVVAAFLLAAGLTLLAASCAGPEAETGPVDRKVLVLGIDGLEWDIMGPMMETGRLPNFSRLVAEGAWGELRSLEYLESPMIWTSISTGKLPAKHGIMGFTAKGGGRGGVVITADAREARTVWDILGEKGRTVGVTNWLVTWPAEPVNGYLVSDYIKFDWRGVGRKQEDTTYPPDLAEELEDLVVRTEDVPDERAGEFVVGGLPVADEFENRVRTLKSCIAVDETARRIAFHMAETRPTDFTAVYMSGVDYVCHHFWVDAFPGTGDPVSDRESELFGEVIERYYQEADSVLGEFLELADENTTVIVTSDHGHSGPKLRGDKYAIGIAMHDPTGFIALWGKDIAGGRELSEPSVLDITPTLLALYGLPVAGDMDGRVLDEAISDEFLARHAVSSVDTYEPDTSGMEEDESESPVESPVDDEIKERLRSLGYIE
ncbi:MAG: sulfatase-like hydrolase/transferase [Candidatus Eisenbacteria bacterium]|nr:sulfatase-like hydrolase/transferase [Candidatus Eisenbacteria bacterium]